MAVLDRLRDRSFRRAREQGRHEPSEVHGADAMLEMARRAAGASAGAGAGAVDPGGDGGTDGREGGAEPAPPVRGTKIVVRIDWDALTRGWPVEGEVSEIAGLGPVPVSLVRAMMESGDAFLAAVVTKGVDVHTVAHLGRRPIAVQETGLDWLQPTCTAEGCNALARLQIDHRHEWADTKRTLLPWLDRLCTHHHDLKTRQNWQLAPGHGKRPMVAPHDPRHPAHGDRASPSTRAA